MRQFHPTPRALALALILITAVFIVPPAFSQPWPLSYTVKIMPLGNSITYGRYTIELRPPGQIPGYRQPLWQKLNEAGYNVNFVGSQSTGYDITPPFDTDHEGHPGWRDDQVADSIYTWLTANPADLVLLHIGTNALDSSSNDVKRILDEIDRYENDHGVTITVLLARIINRSPVSSLTTTFNDNVQAMAAQRISNGDRIIMVDMENGAGIDYRLTPDGDMEDQLHPFETGYAKMAQKWFNSLTTVLPFDGLSFPPAPTSLANTDKTSNSASFSWNDNSYSEQGFILERVGRLPNGLLPGRYNSSKYLVGHRPRAHARHKIFLPSESLQYPGQFRLLE